MKIYCSGIGGIGLSAYAALQRAAGNEVSGSDRSQTALTEDLRLQSIDVTDVQDGSRFPPDADLFVYSEAIPEEALERVRATELGIRSLSYFQALGELSAPYRVIAVCGTHGKSSTTAMAAKVLIEAGLDPTVIVGTKVPCLGGRNWRLGTSDLFLLEACEYRGSFLHLNPTIILMTNVDGDHFDAYSSLEEYQDAFVTFLKRLPPKGTVIFHGGDADARRVAERCGKHVIDADARPLPTLHPNVPGLHMQQNAQLVLALGDTLGIPQAKAKASLLTYDGIWRRLEEKGRMPGDVIVVDDYGHHPREIVPTIAAARIRYPGRRLVCVFQPHMHERLQRFFDAFATSFNEADLVLVTDVYEARRENPVTLPFEALKGPQALNGSSVEGDAERLANAIGKNALYAGTLSETERRLRQMLQPRDVVLCIGAGDITDLAERLVTVVAAPTPTLPRPQPRR